MQGRHLLDTKPRVECRPPQPCPPAHPALGRLERRAAQDSDGAAGVLLDGQGPQICEQLLLIGRRLVGVYLLQVAHLRCMKEARMEGVCHAAV